MTVVLISILFTFLVARHHYPATCVAKHSSVTATCPNTNESTLKWGRLSLRRSCSAIAGKSFQLSATSIGTRRVSTTTFQRNAPSAVKYLFTAPAWPGISGSNTNLTLCQLTKNRLSTPSVLFVSRPSTKPGSYLKLIKVMLRIWIFCWTLFLILYFLISSISKHIRIKHHGQKPFKCDVCKMAFVTKCNLINHMWQHKGVRARPFKCQQCNKSYLRQSLLEAHMRSHRGKHLTLILELKHHICSIF